MIKKPKQYNPKAHDAFYALIDKLAEREKRTVNTAVAREYVSNRKPLPCVEYLLQNGAEEGQRNNCTIALASSLFQIGHSREEVIEILDTWNQTKNEVPISDRELYTTINSAYNNSRNGIYYGCSAFRELGVCVKNCPINKQVIYIETVRQSLEKEHGKDIKERQFLNLDDMYEFIRENNIKREDIITWITTNLQNGNFQIYKLFYKQGEI